MLKPLKFFIIFYFDWMKVPPLCFCVQNFVPNPNPALLGWGTNPVAEIGAPTHGLLCEDDYASLASKGVQHRLFPGDHPSSLYQPHPTGLNFGEQTGTSVSLCCFKPYIIHLCLQLAICPCILGLGCFTYGKKILTAHFLLPTMFRDKHEENHKPALHKVNQLCIE